MHETPIQFEPHLIPKVWGGHRLAEIGKKLPPNTPIGESWELADMPGDGHSSMVRHGESAGRTLRELLQEDASSIMGRVPLNSEGRFPLLIKFLDACDNLSVQVHPDQAWAESHPEAHLKSEAWVVMDAEPNSQIWAGVTEGTDSTSMLAALKKDTLTKCLQSRAAIKGSCHMLPSGTCHALGKGVLVAEIQTTSDTTFRLWDWGRTGRTMHVQEALACINYHTQPPPEVPPTEPSSELTETLLAETPWFQMRRVDCINAATWQTELHEAPMVMVCLNGTASAAGPNKSFILNQGGTMLLPACMEHASLELSDGSSILIAQPTA